MKDKTRLTDLIKKFVQEPYKQHLIDEITPSIRLKTKDGRPDKPGVTKLGGIPDLPVGQEWPSRRANQEPYSFLAQVNLAEIHPFDLNGQLPLSGLLYFFFNVESGDDGKVLFAAEPAELYTPAVPEALRPKEKSFFQKLFTGSTPLRMFKECPVDIFTEYHIPSWDSLRMERICKMTGTDIQPVNAFIDEESQEAFWDEGESEMTSNHHFLGPYNGIQNEFHELSITNSLKTVEELSVTEINEILKWKLLFQLDSDKLTGFSWADWGRLYFFIHETDLQKRDFSRVRIAADCY